MSNMTGAAGRIDETLSFALSGQKSTWHKVRESLRLEVGEAAFRTWLKPLNLMSCEEGVVRLGVPSRFMRDWVAGNYADRIRQLWQGEDDQLLQLEIIVQAPLDNDGDRSPDKPSTPNGVADSKNAHGCAGAKRISASVLQGSEENPSSTSKLQDQGGVAKETRGKWEPLLDERNGDQHSGLLSASLDFRFTFDNFVVGKPNELAYAAARRVAEAGKVPFNPLFLYGGVGLGKTHLMHAIAWHLRISAPEKQVIYLSAEKFMYQFIRAVRTKDTMSFKEQFRKVDVLMIDDVQFISGRESTQEEFFHTFNALVDQNRQVIISADKSPSDLDGMEERLRSRLGWGLVADIHPTTYELRLGILQSKCESLEVAIPHKVLEFLAHKITSNVRELEGALNRIAAHATLVGREINIETTQELLRDLLRANDRRITIEEIQRKVAEHYAVRISDMHSARRARVIARPRQIAMYLSKQLTSRSLPEIGRKFGGRDHTTVMHAVKKIQELIATDGAMEEEVKLLQRMLSS